ncbi:aldehyde dehydrogenase family protein [Rhizobium tibeticum]|uniref:aldehyde dehydrogenase family protein n=1 Tax=Rhizobium tibeticum TaxID=501024 RepID=UPI001160B92B|nr:aldehyde dehydrogenase family protein [Rhizobium tibeticum]
MFGQLVGPTAPAPPPSSKKASYICRGKSLTTLTPVTLKLSGKSPCVVAPDLPIRLAERIVWAKVLDAGQVCTSVDYCSSPRPRGCLRRGRGQ